MVLDAALFNIQNYKVCIKSKIQQSREKSCALTVHLGVVTNEKEAFRSLLTMIANFTFSLSLSIYIYI